MSNPNTLHTATHEHESPLHMTRRGRVLAASATAIALLTGAGAVMSSHNAEASRVEHLTPPSNAEALRIDALIAKGHDDQYVLHRIKQDESPSLALENYASELNAIDNLGYVQGQQFATLESAQKLTQDIENITGGAVKAGDEVVTWRDDTTGLIVSRSESAQ